MQRNAKREVGHVPTDSVRSYHKISEAITRYMSLDSKRESKRSQTVALLTNNFWVEFTNIRRVSLLPCERYCNCLN